MYLTRLIFSFSLLFLSFQVFGQQLDNKQLSDKYFEEAKILNQQGLYDEANVIFRKILALSETIPSELCYHFAETLYGVGQYQNSKNFIDKYFELTGRIGDNYNEVKMLEQMVNEEMQAIRECDLCNAFGYRLIACEECGSIGTVSAVCHYCHGNGISVCTKCKGEGVLITANDLGGDDYFTCDRCNGDGLETCPLCLGTKTLVLDCLVCNGTRKQPGHELCDHEVHDHPTLDVHYQFEKSSN